MLTLPKFELRVLDYFTGNPHNITMRNPWPSSVITSADIFSDAFPLRLLGGHLVEDYPVHRHEFIELVVILRGQGVHLLDDVRYPVAAGDVFVVQGDQAHGFVENAELRLMNVIFMPERLGIPEAALRALPGYHALFTLEPRWRRRHQFRSRLRLNSHELTNVAGLLDRLQCELDDRRPGFAALCLAWMLELLVMLSRCYSADTRGESRQVLQMAQVISLLETQYADPLTLQDLADAAGMSVNHLLRRFKQATGLSPIEYRIRLRVDKGAILLRETTLSITDIAQSVGFTDSNYFSRQFTRLMGHSPRAYRRR